MYHGLIRGFLKMSFEVSRKIVCWIREKTEGLVLRFSDLVSSAITFYQSVRKIILSSSLDDFVYFSGRVFV